jgi:putative hydrolase of the HAD superfamily
LSDASDSPLRAVLFDATGTLIELRESVGERYARIAARHGVELPAWRLDDAFRRVVARAGPRVFPEASGAALEQHERDWWRRVVRDTFRATDQTVRFADFEAFFRELFEGYAGADAWRAREGVRETLQALRADGLALGVVSDFDYRLPAILESLDLADSFETVILAGPHGVTKPDRRLFEAALAELGVPARAAAYVGDDPKRDLAGAAAAGLAAVDVTGLAAFTELPARLATLCTPRERENR